MKEKDSQRDRETERQRDRDADIHMYMYIYIYINIHNIHICYYVLAVTSLKVISPFFCGIFKTVSRSFCHKRRMRLCVCESERER